MKCPKCQKKLFTSTLEFKDHTDQYHGPSTLTIVNKCYKRDPTDFLFHCDYPGCEQVSGMVHRQDFQNHIRRQHLSKKENKHTNPSSNISLAVRTPHQGQLIRRDSSPYSRNTERECCSMVSCKGNMAQNSSLIFFSASSYSACREGPKL